PGASCSTGYPSDSASAADCVPGRAFTATASQAAARRRAARSSSGSPRKVATAFSPPNRVERPPAITTPTARGLASMAMDYISSAMQTPRVLGIVGWSGSGKTVLVTRLIPHFVQQGLRVATLKHAHHAFDVDTPGKDSYERRKAGAREAIICSAPRRVPLHEVRAAPAPLLYHPLGNLSP